MKEFYIPVTSCSIYCYATYIADRDVHKYHESNLFRREQRKYKYFKIIC